MLTFCAHKYTESNGWRGERSIISHAQVPKTKGRLRHVAATAINLHTRARSCVHTYTYIRALGNIPMYTKTLHPRKLNHRASSFATTDASIPFLRAEMVRFGKNNIFKSFKWRVYVEFYQTFHVQ
jgi:hypothetical protein